MASVDPEDLELTFLQPFLRDGAPPFILATVPTISSETHNEEGSVYKNVIFVEAEGTKTAQRPNAKAKKVACMSMGKLAILQGFLYLPTWRKRRSDGELAGLLTEKVTNTLLKKSSSLFRESSMKLREMRLAFEKRRAAGVEKKALLVSATSMRSEVLATAWKITLAAMVERLTLEAGVSFYVPFIYTERLFLQFMLQDFGMR